MALIASIVICIAISCIAYLEGEGVGYNQGNKIGYEQGYAVGKSYGINIGYNSGYLEGTKDGAGTGYNIRDPTFQEMTTFIENDKTEQHTWTEIYTCFNFANDVLVHAFDSGYKAGLVYVEFKDGAHSIVCFDTTDQGLQYIEPQSDDIVSLQVGKAYDFVEEPNIVISYTIIW